MKRRFFLSRFRSLILLTLIPLVVFGLCIFTWLYHEVHAEAETHSEALNNQVKQHFSALVTEMNAFKSMMDYDASLNLLLIRALRNEHFPYASQVSLADATDVMQSSVSTRDYLSSMYISAPGSEYYIADGARQRLDGAADRSWTEALNRDHSNSWAAPRQALRYRLDEDPTRLVTFYQRMRYNMVLAVNVYRDSLDGWLRTTVSAPGRLMLVLTDGGETLLFSNCGEELLSSSLMQSIRRCIAEETAEMRDLDGYYARFDSSGQFGLHYVSLFAHAELYRLPDLIRRLMIAATLVSVVLCAVGAALLTMRDYRQIDRIIQVFENARSGREPEALPTPAVDDTPYYHILSEVIHLFLSRSYLTVQLDAKKYALLAAQLSALQYQMNPHFLFNTLQAIDLEILKAAKRRTPANQMISHLSALLRYSLEDPGVKVSIAREIEMTEHYIAVQKLKKGDRFTVVWNCSDEAARCQTLRMLLQPLVENALTHAQPPQEERLQIAIDVACDEKTITFTVTDNGLPMPQETLDALRQSIAEEAVDPSGRHIGLKNIRMRVRLAYENGGLEIGTLPGQGLCVRFTIDREEPDCPQTDTF